MIIITSDCFVSGDVRLQRARRNVPSGSIVTFWYFNPADPCGFQTGVGLVVRRSRRGNEDSQGFSDVLVHDGRVVTVSNVDLCKWDEQ